MVNNLTVKSPFAVFNSATEETIKSLEQELKEKPWLADMPVDLEKK